MIHLNRLKKKQLSNRFRQK